MNNRRQIGFTLIELMIVVAIVGIISAIAYPSYKDSITRSKRTDAKVSLTELAGNLERCFTMNGQYMATTTPAKACAATSTSATSATAATPTTTASDKNYYTIGGTINATSFSITATPNGWTENNCNVYTLTNTGGKTVSGSWGSTRCWND
jgi:type IV pilus assembly protein PilE